MINGFTYKWIDITDWEFSRINQITHKLRSEGWELDGVVNEADRGVAIVESAGNLSLRFKRQAAA